MTTKPYDYNGIIAEYWDLLRGDTSKWSSRPYFTVTLFGDPYIPTNYDWSLPNPIGFIPIAWFEGPFIIVWGVGLLTMLSASVVSLFSRYRHAHMVERQQIKWLLYVGAVFMLVYAAFFSTALRNPVPWTAG